jgi:hypothetical protein
MRSAVATAAVTLAACGGSHATATTAEATGWDCRSRAISYIAAHAIAAAEVGVQMDCAHGPHIKRWQVDAKTNERHETARAMTPAEFDKVWAEFAGIGWENLHDCRKGDGGKSAPLYQFDVKDDQNTASFSCQSLHVPYPYNNLVDPLDAAAAQGASE